MIAGMLGRVRGGGGSEHRPRAPLTLTLSPAGRGRGDAGCRAGALVVAVGLLLVGCASSPKQQDAAGQAACRRDASNDPQVRQLTGRAVPGTYNIIFDKSFSTPDMLAREAYQKALLDCLQRRGLALPGGVEPVRRYPYSPFGF